MKRCVLILMMGVVCQLPVFAQQEAKTNKAEAEAVAAFAWTFAHSSVANQQCASCHQGSSHAIAPLVVGPSVFRSNAPYDSDTYFNRTPLTTGFLLGSSEVAGGVRGPTTVLDLQLGRSASGEIDWSHYGTGAAAPNGLQFGKCSMVVLANKLFKSHLPIKDEPALLVTKSTVESEGDGLQAGDVVLVVADTSVAKIDEMRKVIEADRAAKITVKIVRGGKHKTLQVPASDLARPEQHYLIGVQVEAPTEALRAQLRLYENEGLLVTDTVANSPAQKAGIQKYDVLLRAGDARVSKLDDLRKVVDASKGAEILYTMMRAGKEITVPIAAEPETINATSFDFSDSRVYPYASYGQPSNADNPEFKIEVEKTESKSD